VAGTAGGSVMLAAALTLLWRWRGRNEQSSNLKTRGEVMETMEKTIYKPDRTIETVTRNNRWLILAVVVLLAALVALGAWLLVDNVVTSDVEALLDDYRAAWVGNDAEALASLVTEDVRYVDHNAGVTVEGLEDLIGNVAYSATFGYDAEKGTVSVNGDWVSERQQISFEGRVWEGFSVLQIEGNLIKQHHAFFSPRR